MTDTELINWYQEHMADLPKYTDKYKKWEFSPWSDSPRWETLREALVWGVEQQIGRI